MDIYQLAARFNLSPRTIHRYTAEGYIPPPIGKGPATHYTLAHIDAIQDYIACKHAFTTPREIIRHCREEGITPREYLTRRLQSTLENAQGVG